MPSRRADAAPDVPARTAAFRVTSTSPVRSTRHFRAARLTVGHGFAESLHETTPRSCRRSSRPRPAPRRPSPHAADPSRGPDGPFDRTAGCLLARASQSHLRVMRMRSAPSPGCRTPARLTTRKVGRARVLLGRRPALLSELDSLQVAAAGALSGALGGPVVLEARAGDTPLMPGRALGHSALFCILALAGPGSEAVLELDPRLAAALASVRTGAAVPDVPVLAVTPFERALVAELLLTVLAALREVGTAESRWSPRLVGVCAGRCEVEARLGPGPVVALAFDLVASAVRGRAVLYIPELALRAVALQVPVARADGVAGDGPGRASINFSPRLRCGAVWAHELAALVTGAAVVLPGAHVADGVVHGQLALVRRGVALAGTLSSAGFRLACAEQEIPSQEVTEVDPVLSELPVELEVELARVPLSLAEIGALRPGAVLPLRVSTGDPVFLRVGDRRIARAELVEVEGEVAARVLELVP